MIIPDNLSPSWTNRDIVDANAYAEQRYKLWLANKCVALWPQVFSWMVVNIYPAHPQWDYRFDAEFADKAILVTFAWDKSGRGCQNSACYRTYPKGRMCTHRDPPIIFPSGEDTDVVACQPACYMKQRLHALRQRLPADTPLFDQNDPRRCVECAYLDESITTSTRIRRLDGSYLRYHTQDKSWTKEPAETGTPVRFDAQQNIQTDTETPFLVWDPQLQQCIIPNEFAFQQVVEPWWRDPSHSVCRVTNFRHGNDPVWGYRPKHAGQDDPHDFSFLVRHSRTYCRAFAKDWDSKDGACKDSLLSTILTYTLVGDAMQRWVRRIIDGDWGCADENWAPIDGERQREVDPTRSTSANHYLTWRADINVSGFTLPPANARLSDLGIDVRVTGNRLYWNSHEGIISQLPLFNAVESYRSYPFASSVDEQKTPNKKRQAMQHAPYRNYNPHFYQKRLDNDIKPHDTTNAAAKCEARDKEEMEKALYTLTDSLQKKRHILEERLQEKREAQYVLRADDRDRQLDISIQTQLHALRHKLTARAVPGAADRLLNVNMHSVNYSKSLPEYLAEQYLLGYVDDDKTPPSRAKRHVAPFAPRTLIPGNDADKTPLNDLIDHINETGKTNKFWQSMQEIGIAVTTGAGEVLLQKSLSYGYKKTLQWIARKSEGLISQSLLKAGLRLGQARIAGVVGSRLATRTLMAIGSFASGIGLVIGAVQLISLVFDIAGMAGWDPGNYRSETDLSVYRDIADFFNYAKESAGRGPFTPFEMMTLLTAIDHSAENSERLDGNGTANVNEPVSSENKVTLSPDKGLPIDERVSEPKWFNRNWPQCFTKSSSKAYLAIDNEQQSWLLAVFFDYLGSLTTNAYGQRIVSDPINVRLSDEDMARLFMEADYRALTTRLALANVDNRQFNQRVNSALTLSRYLLPLALVGLGIGVCCTQYVVPASIAQGVLFGATGLLLFIIVLLVLFFSLTLLPITDGGQGPPSDKPHTLSSPLTDELSSANAAGFSLTTLTTCLRAITRALA